MLHHLPNTSFIFVSAGHYTRLTPKYSRGLRAGVIYFHTLVVTGGAAENGQLLVLEVQQITVQRGTRTERERGREEGRVRPCALQMSSMGVKFEHYKVMLLTFLTLRTVGRKKQLRTREDNSCFQWGYSLHSLTYYNSAL